MMLGLSTEEIIARARADLRIGAPVCVLSGEAGGIALSSEMAAPRRLSEMRGLGDLDIAVTVRRAETLKARAYDGDIARIAVTDEMGISGVHAIADPALAMTRPMLGPFLTRREGSAGPHRVAIWLAKAARLLPSALIASMDAKAARAIAEKAGLTVVNDQMVAEAEAATVDLTPVAAARVPLAVSEASRVHVFRPRSGEEEHYAIEIGRPDRTAPVLSRLHSACFTGDLIGSLKCDCGPQLQAALRQIGDVGAGVLLYLNQEGRGIGLANKMRAYSLQDEGYDTVEANHRLGFEDDERDFRIGAAILQRLGFSAVRLLTNNPGKIAAMEATGVAVAERVPLIVGETAHNVAYLKTKAKKSGHLL
ncbi:MAG: GTP cyclohydrolase II [Pseudomonadota bacterium]